MANNDKTYPEPKLNSSLKHIGTKGEYRSLRASDIQSVKTPTVEDVRYNENKKQIRQNNESIKNRIAKIEEIDRQINTLGISGRIKSGYLSLIYLSIVGLIIPTIMMPISQELHLKVKFLIIVLFISGLAAVFYYIYSELRYIEGKGS